MGNVKIRTVSTIDATTVKGIKMKSMYNVSEITNRTNKNLWVVFQAGHENSGLVFSMVYSRDQVRNAFSKIVGTNISNIRSRRIKNFRKN
jgi:hypothetical protein